MLAATGKRFYCICFSIRSGSTLLCDDLTQWGVGTPAEWFHVNDPRLVGVHVPDHLVGLTRTPFDYFGFKISWDQAWDLTQRLRSDGDESVRFDLRTVFPDLRYIRIVRGDKTAQAISAWRAQMSGTWHVPVGSASSPGFPEYDFEGIKPYLQQVLGEEWLWQFHFQQVGIQPLEILYEDYIADRVGHLDRIVDFLGASASPSPLEDRLHVMRDDWTERMAEKFQEDLYKVPDPILVRSVVVEAPNTDDQTIAAIQPLPAVVPAARRRTPFRWVPAVGVAIAVFFGVVAVEERLPQIALAPVLILAPLLAALLVSAGGIAAVAVLAALLVIPLGFSDNISGATQFAIITGILVAGSLAVWISRNAVDRPIIDRTGTSHLAADEVRHRLDV
jgi:LPS sulfotransferase NodH